MERLGSLSRLVSFAAAAGVKIPRREKWPTPSSLALARTNSGGARLSGNGAEPAFEVASGRKWPLESGGERELARWPNDELFWLAYT